jgi:hypothetical protein
MKQLKWWEEHLVSSIHSFCVFVWLSTLRTTLLSLNGLELHGSFIAVPMLIISKHGMFKD